MQGRQAAKVRSADQGALTAEPGRARPRAWLVVLPPRARVRQLRACGAWHTHDATLGMPDSQVVLIDDLWTPDNDMLTAVNKLKRKQIVDKHRSDIDRVYI